MSTRSRRIAPGTHLATVWNAGIVGDVSLLYDGSPAAELRVSGDGTLELLDAAGVHQIIPVQAGQVLRCQIVEVYAAGSADCAPLTAVW